MTMPIQPTEQEWDEIANFKMPKPHVNDMVCFYNAGDTSGEPKWGLVQRVDDRSIWIFLCSPDCYGRRAEGCRHIDDPDLKFKMGLRSKGTWGFHQAYIEREARLTWIEDRLKALEAGKPLVVRKQVETNAAAELKSSLAGVKELNPAREQEIVDLHAEGKKPKEIAEFLGAGWTPQRIGLILKNTTMTPSEPVVA